MPLRKLSDKEKSVLYLHLACHFSVAKIVRIGGMPREKINELIEKHSARYLEILKLQEKHDINYLSAHNQNRPEFGTYQIPNHK